jgi:hypothetical protein
MKRNLRPFWLLGLLLGSSPVLAAKVEKPQPPAELGVLKYFLGTWRCKGNLYAMPGRPEGPFTATIKIKPELDGHWASVTYVQRKTKQNPTPVNALFWYGYDAKNKKYVSTYLNNYGARGHMTNPGWQGDKWIDTGYVMDRFGEKMPMRMTSTKLGKNKIKVLLEVKGPEGWLPINDEVCNR